MIFKRFFTHIKWALQRARNGYCDRDVCEIDTWFLDIIPRMLKEFKLNHTGYPYSLKLEFGKTDAPQQWNDILGTMISLFHKAQEESAIEERERCKNEAFALFSKYFFYLWD